MKQFTVHHVPPETLKPYFRNTKIHSEEHVRKMVRVLDKYHFDQPIVVSPDMVIIKGHGRYMASLMTQKKRLVPIIIRDDLTEAQMMAARISDNRLFELGESIPELIQTEVIDFVSEGGLLESQFMEFIPKGVLQKEAMASLEGIVTAGVLSIPLKTQPAAPQGKTVEMSSDVDLKVDPAPPVSTKAKPVYCPNCNQLHEQE